MPLITEPDSARHQNTLTQCDEGANTVAKGQARPLFQPMKRTGAAFTSRWRAIGAAASTILVGTWSARRAYFELVPRDIHTADPTRASEWLEGYIALAGDVIDLQGRKLFSIAPPSDAFARELHSFEWLRHVRAFELASATPQEAQRIAARAAREHLMNWIETRRRHPALAHTPQMAARRALALTNHASFLLDDAEPATYRAIMACILDSTRSAFVRRSLVSDPTDHCMLIMACASVAYALGEHIALKQQTRQALSQALKEAFNADGGPRSRRPGDLPPLLAGLISLKALIEGREMGVPQELLESVENGMRFLRMMRHRDGTLARFQGTTAIASLQTDLVASILFFDTERGPLPILAAQTGYARLEAPDSVVLIDCGGPPPPQASSQAHASALAFEWSLGRCKIITNAPEIGYTVDADILDQRRTMAHSTLCVGGVSSARFAGPQADCEMTNPGMTVSAQKSQNAPTRGIRARHTGYRQQFGVDHLRTLSLSDNGRVVEGHDQLVLSSGAVAANNRNPFKIAFQLQPGAKVRSESERRLRIAVQHHSIVFEADAGTVSIEDPTDRPTYRGPSRARRIIVSGPLTGPSEVRWRLIAQPVSSDSEAEKDTG